MSWVFLLNLGLTAKPYLLQSIRATFGYEYDNREGILLEKVLHNLDMPIQMASYELI